MGHFVYNEIWPPRFIDVKIANPDQDVAQFVTDGGSDDQSRALI
jgi:hypothetical protein